MLKKAILATTAIIACSFFANQAQAVTQTIQWSFSSLSHTTSAIFSGTPLLPGMTNTNDNITLSGGTTSAATSIGSSVNSSQIQGDGGGMGVWFDGNSSIDQISSSVFEFLRIDITNPLTFVTSLNGTWSMRFNGIGEVDNVTVLTSTNLNSASTLLLTTGNNVLNTAFLALDDNPVSKYLFIRQKGSTNSHFQVSGLQFSYDDGCPVGGCTTPEPGMLGLLGFSLLGLAFLRKKQ